MEELKCEYLHLEFGFKMIQDIVTALISKKNKCLIAFRKATSWRNINRKNTKIKLSSVGAAYLYTINF